MPEPSGPRRSGYYAGGLTYTANLKEQAMRLSRNVIGGAGMASALLVTSVGLGQERALCMPYDQARTQLSERFGESPVWHGLSRSGHLLEVWASVDRQTWTVLAITPGGLACALDAGHGWEHVAQAPVGNPA